MLRHTVACADTPLECRSPAYPARGAGQPDPAAPHTAEYQPLAHRAPSSVFPNPSPYSTALSLTPTRQWKVIGYSLFHVFYVLTRI